MVCYVRRVQISTLAHQIKTICLVFIWSLKLFHMYIYGNKQFVFKTYIYMYIKKPREISVFYCLEFVCFVQQVCRNINKTYLIRCQKANGSIVLWLLRLFVKPLCICCIFIKNIRKLIYSRLLSRLYYLKNLVFVVNLQLFVFFLQISVDI